MAAPSLEEMYMWKMALRRTQLQTKAIPDHFLRPQKTFEFQSLGMQYAGVRELHTCKEPADSRSCQCCVWRKKEHKRV